MYRNAESSFYSGKLHRSPTGLHHFSRFPPDKSRPILGAGVATIISHWTFSKEAPKNAPLTMPIGPKFLDDLTTNPVLKKMTSR